jgi:phosphopantothenoylcysteine decarboxylase/phosphopantothenate--cysteine ligase
VLVAFGAESGDDGMERKRRMLGEKNVDLVVYNDVGREDIGFESGDNEVVILGRDGDVHVSRRPKTEVAHAILDRVEELLQ